MSAYSDKVIADGASNYWRLNEPSGTSAVDVVGGKTGTISGGVTLNQPGVAGDTAMAFNGATGKIALPTIALPAAWSIEVWFRTSGTTQQTLFHNAGGTGGLLLYVEPAPNNRLLTFAIGQTPTVIACTASSVANGQWHHFVLTHTASTAVSYLDGVVSATDAQTWLGAGSPFAAFLGVESTANFLNGSLDDVAIYPRALTAAEIAAHYTLGLPTTYAGRVVFDGASNFWRLGETSGTTAVDVIGAKNGTISGGVTLAQPGAIADGDKAMTFNGTTGQIVTAATVTLPVTATIEAWVKTNGSVPAQRPIFNSATNAWNVAVNAGRATFVSANFSPGVKLVDDGQWHHLAFVLASSTVTIYVDGVVDVTKPETRATPATTAVYIGLDAAPSYWLGSLDDVAIYPRALTATEIAAHATLGTTPAAGVHDLNTKLWIYLSGFFGVTPGTSYVERVRADGATNHWRLGEGSGTVAVDAIGGANGTISGGVTLGQPSALVDGDTAMVFDGVTGQVLVPSSATTFGTGAFSLECWLKINGPFEAGGDWILDTKYNGSGNQGVGLYLTGTDIAAVVRTTGQAGDTCSGFAPSLGVWHYIILTLSRGATDVLRLYVDGALLGTTNCAAAGRNYTSTEGLMMAATTVSLTHLACALDDVAIYPRALTANEVAAHYSLGRQGMSGANDLTTLIVRYLATLTGEYTARWKQMERDAAGA